MTASVALKFMKQTLGNIRKQLDFFEQYIADFEKDGGLDGELNTARPVISKVTPPPKSNEVPPNNPLRENLKAHTMDWGKAQKFNRQ